MNRICWLTLPQLKTLYSHIVRTSDEIPPMSVLGDQDRESALRMVTQRAKDRLHSEGVHSISGLAAVYAGEIIDRDPVNRGKLRLAVDAILQFCDQNGAPVQGDRGGLRRAVSMRNRHEVGDEHLAAHIRADQSAEASESQKPASSSV